MPEDPSFYLYRPTLKDASLAPEGHEGLYVMLVPVPELSKFNDWQPNTITNYRNKNYPHAKRKTIFNDIDEHIVFETYYTPQDFQRPLQRL